MTHFSAISRTRDAFRSNQPLNDDQILRFAPSIFATEKHDSRSSRYTVIPTINVLNALRKEGFLPFMVAQTRTRDQDKRGHAKHMIRMRHVNQVDTKQANEIVLLNSHDGSSSYQMIAGVFRFVCENGMVVGDIAEDIRIRHSGDIIDNVIEGAFRVLDNFELVDQNRESMQSILLKPEEQKIFAETAISLKYDTEIQPAPITDTDVLRAKRMADDQNDLWTTFNRIQENLIRGGIRARTANGNITRTREVKGIDQNVKLNRALWTLAEKMRELKS